MHSNINRSPKKCWFRQPVVYSGRYKTGFWGFWRIRQKPSGRPYWCEDETREVWLKFSINLCSKSFLDLCQSFLISFRIFCFLSSQFCGVSSFLSFIFSTLNLTHMLSSIFTQPMKADRFNLCNAFKVSRFLSSDITFSIQCRRNLFF